MRSTNVAENGRKCNYMLNFYNPVRQIDVDENNCNMTFMLPLTDHVISRRNSYVFYHRAVHYFRRLLLLLSS